MRVSFKSAGASVDGAAATVPAAPERAGRRDERKGERGDERAKVERLEENDGGREGPGSSSGHVER